MSSLRHIIRHTSSRINGAVARSLDKAFVQAAFRTTPHPDQVPPTAQMTARLDEATIVYAQAAADGILYQEPARPRVETTQMRTHYGSDGAVFDLQWPSGYTPIHRRYDAALEQCPETRTCHARWFAHTDVAPVMICLHGWGAGEYFSEQLAFPVRWMFEHCGLDIILMNMPFHARRKAKQGRTPSFPGPDPMRSVEGFAQTVHDVRTLVSILLSRGVPWVGVMGMSLGGYTSALLATAEPRLACAVPLMPFASLPDLIWQHSSGTASHLAAIEAGVTLQRYRDAMYTITPLNRTPRIDTTRILIGAGERDGITPATHAHALHEHFDGSHLRLFPGGHLYQYGRSQVFTAFESFLQHHGLHPKGGYHAPHPLTLSGDDKPLRPIELSHQRLSARHSL